MKMPDWKPANNGAGKHPWFLIRGAWAGTYIPLSEQYHINKRGELIRYKDYETAKRRADKLNKKG